MTRTDCPYGFRMVGPVRGTRRLVNAAAAFAAHAACDPRAEPDRECYLSAFHYGDAFREHLSAHGTTKGYGGLCWAPWLWLDIDRAGDLDLALTDTRRLLGFVLGRYPKLDDDTVLVFFSGAKGCHLGLPLTHNPAPSPDFHRTARRLAEGLAAGAGVTIDTAIYDRVRCFRAPNSRHPKTGLHKRQLSLDEVLHLTAARISEMARGPAPFDVPTVGELIAELETDWQEAAALIGREVEGRVGRPHPVRLQRATTDFLRDGAEVGERRPRLFRAAADMAELAAAHGVDALIESLLTEPALDCGVCPADVRRQIGCGIAHARRQHAAGAEGGAP